eukprot:CAMPEP_0202685544 /NCGR_PEP_ID=MMETSP1385-20130828/1337_1 /ASSEMBLY_ACC=CAM_ASM_000861 /TAXON_ID=933848 /ORGANISM="Elphidium margaritaceum" /LENGTH=722 /DNA_ID=CAMNT_0049339921 /DNA_START=95 /DNA_END=2260 /DNA_ORIENTATION=+
MSMQPNFKHQQEIVEEFLKNFKSKRNVRKYVNMLQEVANRERLTVDIELDDFAKYDKNEEVIHDIERNSLRYVAVFSDAIDAVIPSADPNTRVEEDTIDVLADWRVRMQRDLSDPTALQDQKSVIPSQLLRRYEVEFIARSQTEAAKIREIAAKDIGSLIKVRGIVTRITEVRPMMKVATYICDVCGNEIYQVINKKKYTPVSACPSQQCQQNRNKRPVLAQTRGSKFVKFQEIRLQELPHEVPTGHVPRSIAVYAHGECTRHCQCGDGVTLHGIWLPVPATAETNFYGRGNGGGAGSALTTNTYLHCMAIEKEKKGWHESEEADYSDEIAAMSVDAEIYDKLSASIAPEIYGLDDVKKALLLLLVSGVTKTSAEDGMMIRGDINILLMGDPGVAKSQLLKHLSAIAPRCVYTTGKGSSGVGLTAAVQRDPVTHDMVLEGGALVLADCGICCIDEFDKMEESDRTAIHQVMEQQTISIAKAGITTTLNARTSILAAANPAFGRYDLRKTPEININLPAALLSRFDLLFVLVDTPDLDTDLALARHIAYVHQHRRHPQLAFDPFSAALLRAYIGEARTFTPVIPPELAPFIVECYVSMRKQSLDQNGQYDSRKIVGTPRALLSILRLSQALARIRFSNQVAQTDVHEAMRLIKMAKHSTLQAQDIEREFEDELSRIYGDVIAFIPSDRDEVNIAALKTMLTTKGYTDDNIQQCLVRYSSNDVW